MNGSPTYLPIAKRIARRHEAVDAAVRKGFDHLYGASPFRLRLYMGGALQHGLSERELTAIRRAFVDGWAKGDTPPA